MTKFSSLFSVMFKRKNKIMYSFAIIELIISIIFAFGINRDSFSDITVNGVHTNVAFAFSVKFLGGEFLTAIIGMLVFVIVMIYQNYKINNSQTWRLIPVSSESFLSANILSAFASEIYLLLLNAIVITLVGIPVWFGKYNVTVFQGIKKSDVGNIILFFLFIALANISLMLYWIFLDFLIKAVMSYVPASGTTYKVIKAVLFVVILIASGQLMNQISTIFQRTLNISSGMLDDMGLSSLSWISEIVYIIVLALLNNWLMKKYVEADNK